MKIENDLARGRTRVRFTIQEIEKYSGEGVPETVIKNWIYLGRNLDNTLKEIASIVEKSTDVSTIQSVDYRLGEIEKSLKQLQTTISLFADSFVEVGRILAFAASYQLKKAEHESPELRRFLKARDEDYLSYFAEIFPKFKPGYLVKRFFRGGDQ